MISRLYEVKIDTDVSSELLKLAEVKHYLRLSANYTDDDDLLRSLITSARRMVERMTNRTIGTKTLVAYYDDLQEIVYLPFPPIQSVISVVRIYNNISTTLTENTDYYVQASDETYLKIVGLTNELPSGFSPDDKSLNYELKITYQAGYTSLPDEIKEAMLMIIADRYMNRSIEERKEKENNRFLEKEIKNKLSHLIRLR